MKILSIRLKNLASLSGEHFIDFESEPLASSGLIAIVGKTGAGKSTILDAMCLALFNRVPRLKDSDGKLLDVDGSELLTNSPLTVLRRGTGHGFAELSFIAQDQKVYLARWEIKRARENPNGKLQSVQRSLKCLTDGNVVADKAKAVETHIQQITQLSFEQFTRAVLLAQSEVTAFLKARDNERGELLEYLTNSSIFGKIGQLAYEKTKQIANQRKELENVIGHIEILSEEAVLELNQQFQDSDEQVQKLTQEKSVLDQHKQWFEQKQKLENDVQQRQQYALSQQQKSDLLNAERVQLTQLETFSSIRSSVLQQQKSKHELDVLQPKLIETEQQFLQIQQHYQAEEVQFKQVDDQLKQQQHFEQNYQIQLGQVRTCIQEREFIAKQFVKAKTTLDQLQQHLQPLLQQQHDVQAQLEQLKSKQAEQNQLLTESVQFQSLDDGLSAHIVQLQRFIQQHQNFEKSYGDSHSAKQHLVQKQQQFNQLDNEQKIDQQLAELRLKQNQNTEQQHLLGLVQNQFQQFSLKWNEQQQLQARCSEQSQKLEQINELVLKNEQLYLQHKTERESLQRVLQQQRLLHAENIEKLRDQLVEGEACIVCGSTHHPYKADQTSLSNELFDLQQQQEQQAITLEQQSLQSWQIAQRDLAQLNAELTQNQKRLNDLNADLQQNENNLQHAFNQIGITFDLNQNLEQTTQQITQIVEKAINEKNQIAQQIQKLELAQKSQRELVQEIQKVAQQLSILEQAEQNIQHIISLLNDEQQTNWQQQTLQQSLQIAEQLQTRKQLLDQAAVSNQQFIELNQSLNQKLQEIQNTQQHIHHAEKEQAEYTQKGKDNTHLAIQTILEMTQEKVEKPHEWLIQYDHQRKETQHRFNQVRQDFERIRQQFDNQQRQLDQLKVQKAQIEAQHHACAVEIEQWLNQHSDFNHALIEQLRLISHEEMQLIRQKIQLADRELADAQSALKTYQSQLEQHLLQQPNIQFEQLQIQFNELVESLKHAQEIRDGFKLKLELHQRNLDKQKQFAAQIEKIQTEEHRWNKISSLMGDATGKKFRDYAQQYNLDILIEYANQQLALLSQRYTLKRLDNSLSLAIIDHDMDGETRSVSSLSGGESFLTALALSLAIANMASGSMKIESLFIDEGFGTLDASSLHMVMNALDQLQSQGRKVVLISHIQEMHERIPVQIQVKPLGAGASTIEVVS